MPLDVAITETTAEQALAVLRLYRSGVRETRRRGGPRPKVASNAEVTASLARQLPAFRARADWRRPREAAAARRYEKGPPDRSGSPSLFRSA